MAHQVLPLTGDELRSIAELVDSTDKDESGFFASPWIGRIEILEPDGREVIGYLQSCDDWYGFMPATPEPAVSE